MLKNKPSPSLNMQLKLSSKNLKAKFLGSGRTGNTTVKIIFCIMCEFLSFSHILIVYVSSQNDGPNIEQSTAMVNQAFFYTRSAVTKVEKILKMPYL